MLILVLNGVAIDPTKEWEIFSETGFTVDVIFNQERPGMNPRRVKNVTELHWRYDLKGKSLALESDIDSAGQTLEIDWVQIVRVVGKVGADSPFDDLIDSWHESLPGIALHEFLGMSLEEYGDWVVNPRLNQLN